MILNIDNELSTAYFLKENYVSFNATATVDNAEKFLNEQLENIISKNIPEFNDIHKMLMNWKEEIINSFNLDSNGKCINNSVIGGKNKIIKKL